jgi:hypothetical protein
MNCTVLLFAEKIRLGKVSGSVVMTVESIGAVYAPWRNDHDDRL